MSFIPASSWLPLTSSRGHPLPAAQPLNSQTPFPCPFPPFLLLHGHRPWYGLWHHHSCPPSKSPIRQPLLDHSSLLPNIPDGDGEDPGPVPQVPCLSPSTPPIPWFLTSQLGLLGPHDASSLAHELLLESKLSYRLPFHHTCQEKPTPAQTQLTIFSPLAKQPSAARESHPPGRQSAGQMQIHNHQL